jgi:hypothetical protein
MEELPLTEETDFYTLYPITWITKSQVLLDYISSESVKEELLVADFASGENDSVSSFLVEILPRLHSSPPKRTTVYCTDIHALRLDSLLGKLEESNLLDNVRVVQAKLEKMDSEASFRPDMIDYLERRNTTMTDLDHHLKNNSFIPNRTFDIGVLNNDVVGYLHEYYKEYSDAMVGLRQIYKSLKKGALLVVTMPCSLYAVDNIEVLESIGFEFLEGKDIDLSEGSVLDLDRDSQPHNMSRLGHYTFLIFVSK